jgi:hypothetical protein
VRNIPSIYLRKDLYDEIRKLNKDVTGYVNKIVEESIKGDIQKGKKKSEVKGGEREK